MRSHTAIPLALVATALLAAGCGGGRSPSSRLHDRLLASADLPAGWSALPVSAADAPSAKGSCFSGLPAKPKGWTYASAAFVQGTSIPTFAEVLAAGPQARAQLQRLDRALAHCRRTTLVVAGAKVEATVHAVSLPGVGGRTSAYAWAFTLAGIRIGSDLVLFEVGAYTGYVTYADLGSPEPATVRAFAAAAAAKARGATARVPDSVSAASAPVRVARTRLGAVAYRVVGSGPPLVLVTGYRATMEGWDRRFVDALARRHRVVLLDNAGVGRTAALPGRLTIDGMADQTSALLAALGLRRADVLGWSMGGMVAQALAVRHPAQVRRLVLCATFPGTGAAVRPSRAAVDALNGGDSTQVLADLFPADRTAARNAYLAATSSYPAATPASAAVATAQARAVDAWWSGRDPAGRKTRVIAVPTLVADGAEDRLDPVANSRALAALIPGAALELYPDAGHAFLFQERAAFVPLLESFLGPGGAGAR